MNRVLLTNFIFSEQDGVFTMTISVLKNGEPHILKTLQKEEALDMYIKIMEMEEG